MKNTKIPWTHHTVNFWHGCEKVSEACTNCYAKRWGKRFGKDCYGHGKQRIFREIKAMSEIANLNYSAEKRGVIETVFVNSMSDFFDNAPGCKNIRSYAYDVFFTSRNLVFLILTKRPENITHLDIKQGLMGCHNVRLGITVENQKRLDERMNKVNLLWLQGFSKQVFLSAEPLLEPLDISAYDGLIDWVICGGESGPKARPFHEDWARGINRQCLTKLNYVPCFYKQDGANFVPTPKGRLYRQDMVTTLANAARTTKKFPDWHSMSETFQKTI